MPQFVLHQMATAILWEALDTIEKAQLPQTRLSQLDNVPTCASVNTQPRVQWNGSRGPEMFWSPNAGICSSDVETTCI